MQTLHNLYQEDPEVFERLDRAMQRPPRLTTSNPFQLKQFATRFKAWQELPATRKNQVKRVRSLVWRTLNARLTLRSIALQKLTK